MTASHLFSYDPITGWTVCETAHDGSDIVTPFTTSFTFLPFLELTRCTSAGPISTCLVRLENALPDTALHIWVPKDYLDTDKAEDASDLREFWKRLKLQPRFWAKKDEARLTCALSIQLSHRNTYVINDTGSLIVSTLSAKPEKRMPVDIIFQHDLVKVDVSE